MLQDLRQQVCAANCLLAEYKLVTLTWGNVSAIDRSTGRIVIKPSGVAYSELTPEKMVIVDLQGQVVEGDFRPSSDTQTHIRLYQAFPEIGGITHTHSRCATAFAQARTPIVCLGTTHADTFYGDVPVTRALTKDEVDSAYEANTGEVIIERFKTLDYHAIPGVLVAGHAPFTWGKNAASSVENSVILEEVAHMALQTLRLRPEIKPLEQYVLDKHYTRKHGPNSYYGQKPR
jgi:L-ribulose-5-phosphate 4-epimerase